VTVIVCEVRAFPGAKEAQSRKYCSWKDEKVEFDQKNMSALDQMHYLMKKSNEVPHEYDIPAPYDEVSPHLDGTVKYKQIHCGDIEQDLNGLYKPVVNVGQCISTANRWLQGESCDTETMLYQKWDRVQKTSFGENWITTTIKKSSDNGFDCINANHNRKVEKKSQILATHTVPDANGVCNVQFKRGWVKANRLHNPDKAFVRFRFHKKDNGTPTDCKANSVSDLLAIQSLARQKKQHHVNYNGHVAEDCAVTYPKFPNPKLHENPIDKANKAGCLQGVLRRARVFQDDSMPPITNAAIRKRCKDWDGLKGNCSDECENRARLDRIGQQKVLHQIGGSTYVRLDWNTELINQYKYTGVFLAKSMLGLMRLSTGARVQDKTKLSPSVAFKFWRDNTYACEILGMNGFDGVDGDNFWKYPLSTTVSTPKTDTTCPVTNDFNQKMINSVQTKKLKTQERKQPAGHTSLFECALRKMDGTHPGVPQFPFKLDFRTNPIYIVYGEWVLNGHNISAALQKFKLNQDTATKKNPFEVFDMESIWQDKDDVNDQKKYTRFELFLKQLKIETGATNSHMRLLSSSESAARDIEDSKNTFYKVIGHDTASSAAAGKTCDCLGYVNKAFDGHNLVSNKFLDLNVRFSHYMSTQLANNGAYKDADKVRHKYFHRCNKKGKSTDGSDCEIGKETPSEKRWNLNKAALENETLMTKQKVEDHNVVCGFVEPDSQKLPSQFFLDQLAVFTTCSAKSLKTISINKRRL